MVSVTDTPELWRGAAGLCARVRACAGAAESLHTYNIINIYTYLALALTRYVANILLQ